MKELADEAIKKMDSPQQPVAAPAPSPITNSATTGQDANVGISDQGLNKPETSTNSDPNAANPSLFNQLVACKESTSDAMAVSPTPTKEGIDKLYNFITLEQESCLKVVEKLEPLAKDSLATKEFTVALTNTKNRIMAEKKIVYITFKENIDVKNHKNMEKILSMKMGLDMVKNQEDSSWMIYKSALIKEQDRISGNVAPFDWTLVILPVLIFTWFFLNKGPAMWAKYQAQSMGEDDRAIGEKDEKKDEKQK